MFLLANTFRTNGILALEGKWKEGDREVVLVNIFTHCVICRGKEDYEKNREITRQPHLAINGAS